MTQPKGGSRLLVTDREGALYLERARIHVEGDRVVYHITDDELRREYNIPHVNLAVLFMGQGTSITQEALRLLGEESVHVAVTGTGGTPLHMGGLTTYTATRHFRELLPIYLDPARSLAASKAVMRDRAERMKRIGAAGAQRHLRQRDVTPLLRICREFEEKLVTCASIKQLLGIEGAFSKSCYRVFASMAGVSRETPFRREPGAKAPQSKIAKDPVNQINKLIDHGNYLAYGMAGAALWALGLPPHLSVLHGKTRAGGLVFDLADSFKDAFVLPLAFGSLLKKTEEPDKAFRAALISAFEDRRVLVEAIATVERMLEAGGGTRAADA